MFKFENMNFKTKTYAKHFFNAGYDLKTNYISNPKPKWLHRGYFKSKDLELKAFICVSYDLLNIIKKESEMFYEEPNCIKGHAVVKKHYNDFVESLDKVAKKLEWIRDDYKQGNLIKYYSYLSDRYFYIQEFGKDVYFVCKKFDYLANNYNSIHENYRDIGVFE